ncbi:sigma-70 family RNA polymerase sigma factor [Planctomycetota bacterium]
MNENLLNQLIESRRILFSYIRALARNTHDTEDIFQEVAAVIIEHAGKEEEIRNFKAWSFEIARRKTLEWLRKNRSNRELKLPSDEMEDLISKVASNHNSDPDRARDRYLALSECVEQMPEKNRELVKLRFTDDKPFAEIAQTMGKTESAMYKAMTAIRLALAECMQRKLHPAGKES